MTSSPPAVYDIGAARKKLGQMWGLNRPLYMSELGRALRLKGRDPGHQIKRWENGYPVSGPVSVAIEAMLAGYRPPPIHRVKPTPMP